MSSKTTFGLALAAILILSPSFIFGQKSRIGRGSLALNSITGENEITIRQRVELLEINLKRNLQLSTDAANKRRLIEKFKTAAVKLHHDSPVQFAKDEELTLLAIDRMDGRYLSPARSRGLQEP